MYITYNTYFIYTYVCIYAHIGLINIQFPSKFQKIRNSIYFPHIVFLGSCLVPGTL